MARRRTLETRFRDVLRTFNFHEVQTPTFEDLELFEKKAGEGIRGEIYNFKDKGGRDLCLRPELTLPVMRFYFGSELKTLPKPLKLFYFGPCYRYDRPQAGRYREFWQLGTEVVGDATPEAHAELLWLALDLFRAAGLENIFLRVGHLEILRSVLEEACAVPRKEQGPLMRAIDKKDVPAIEQFFQARGLSAESLRKFLSYFDVADLAQIDRLGPPAGARSSLEHVGRVLELLRGFGADGQKVRFDPTIARGLEYYTGLVFELDCPDLGAEKQLLGGGEYDLSGVFGAAPVATVGFGLGFDRTLVALERGGRAADAPHRTDLLVAALSTAGVSPAQRIANDLRAAGFGTELDLGGKGAKKSLARANAVGARIAVLVGDQEVGRGEATLKNLDSGEQVTAPFPEVPRRAAAWLASASAGARVPSRTTVPPG